MRFLIFLILFLQIFDSLSQVKKEEYTSRQEKRYQKRMVKHYSEYKPIPISVIEKIKYKHITIKEQDTDNKFVSVWARDKHQRYVDSLNRICCEVERQFPEYARNDSIANMSPVRYFRIIDSLSKLDPKPIEKPDNPLFKIAQRKCDRCSDSIEQSTHRKPIGGIEYDQIIRYDSSGLKRIILHATYQFGMRGLWLAISNDNGSTWNQYFTDLSENWFYNVKPDSKIRFIKNDSTVQLEAAIVRETKAASQFGISEFQLLHDNLILELNLNLIMLDSDHDGLTDIIENRLLTNPLSKDTDKDGIEDMLDTNPRFKSKKNKNTVLFESLLEGPVQKEGSAIPFSNDKGETSNFTKSRMATYYIVTGNPDLLHINPLNDRFILLNKKEFVQYRKDSDELNQIFFSDFLKIDGNSDSSIIKFEQSNWGSRYIIIKKKKEWIMKKAYRWIS